MAGFDGPALRMLAAVSIHQADQEVADLLEPALREVGLPCFAQGTVAAQQAGLTAMAARVLRGSLTPRELTAWAHKTFGHGPLELAQHRPSASNA
ncbi:hypothetical protein [Nocardia sp. NPDC051570]|uniref:hypothetical protein n=1 Tax=Nocardia sp. NPDC051570 TaxID=3364324 RepID=UPI0037952FB5